MTTHRISEVCAIACAVLASLGCGGAAPYPPATTPEERATIRDSTTQAGVITVALRVTLDAPDDSQHVHLHAVSYDLDGRETTTDLGHYVGTVLQETSEADELIRITIENAGLRRSIRLRLHEGALQAEELPSTEGSVQPTLIERIDMPAGTTVQPSDTPVEQPR